MNALAVYVHVPFCTIKCGYCDFNAYAGMSALYAPYRSALLRDVESWRGTLEGSSVTSIGFGGGTPGEVPPSHLLSVVERVAALGRLAPGAEISVEANPGTTSEAALRALRSGGVTRISFGVQSFESHELRFLDRIHSAEAAIACVALARRAGFSGVNLDLIYGLPGQTLDGWEQTVRRAVALEPDHLSCYCLTVEEGTPLARRVATGEVPPFDPDLAADMYDRAAELLAAAGYRHYEISNWARPGHESRHNLSYWTDQQYLGVGAGAHGYIRGQRYENVAHPRAYIAAAGGPPAEGATLPEQVIRAYRPDPAQRISDWLSLRLRLIDGIPPGAFEAAFGTTLEAAVGPVIRHGRAAGVIEGSGPIRLTSRGLQLHGEVAALLLAHLESNHIPPAAGIPA